MVNFPQGSINLSASSRGPSARGMTARTLASPSAAPAPAGTNTPAARQAAPATIDTAVPWSPTRLVALLLGVLGASTSGGEPAARSGAPDRAGEQVREGGSAQVTGRPTGWHPARLVSALLRLLAGPPAHVEPAPEGSLAARDAAPPLRPELPATGLPRLLEALLRVMTAGQPVQARGPVAEALPADPGAEIQQEGPRDRTAPQAVDRAAPRPPEAGSLPAPRPDLAAPAAGAVAPPPALAQAGAAQDLQQPRAELLPPRDGVRHPEQDNLPLGPALMLAVAIPALVAVLASLF